MAKNNPVTICTTKQTPKEDPNLQFEVRALGVGSEIKFWLIIL